MEARSESKYERLRKIGIGSYGVVFKCVNRQTRQIVAIKRYSENDSDPVIRKIAMREVRMLRQLKHPNLINLIEVFRRKRRLHLVFDYCELTVLDVIEKYANNCPLNLIKKIIWQTVNGINYCHTHNCIHRDIKPENILINQAGVVKLCDFGFARSITSVRSGTQMQANKRESLSLLQQSGTLLQDGEANKENSLNADRQALTEYVATRWYRAPELLIGDVHYGIKIDIWAIGCVTAELMRGEPLWPGKTDYDQLSMIMSSLGQLTSAQMYTLLKQNVYDQSSIEQLLKRTAILGESVEKKLPESRVGLDGVEFVMACVQMDPNKRPTSGDLLQNEYIHSVRMAQFVRGTSHVAGTISNQRRSQGDQLNLDRLQPPSSTTTRSNSQLLMLAAGSHQPSGPKVGMQSPSQSSPKHTKRLIVATGSGKSNRAIQASKGDPKKPSIPVAVPIGHNNCRVRKEERDSKAPKQTMPLGIFDKPSLPATRRAQGAKIAIKVSQTPTNQGYGRETISRGRHTVAADGSNQTDEFNVDDIDIARAGQLNNNSIRGQRTKNQMDAESSASSSMKSISGQQNLLRWSSLSYLPAIGDSSSRRSPRGTNSKK